MPLYMLDTDIFSSIMNRSSEAVLRRLRRVAVEDVCISSIVLSELNLGIETSARRLKLDAALHQYLQYFNVLDYPAHAAKHYARIRAELRADGTPIGGNDLFIAAHAHCLGQTLVTNNTREFSRVRGLKIENWAEGGA